MLQRACGDGRMATPSQRVRFQEPCVLFFAGVDIHSRENPSRHRAQGHGDCGTNQIKSRTRTHLPSRLVDQQTASTT